jgi:hypothetical protein
MNLAQPFPSKKAKPHLPANDNTAKPQLVTVKTVVITDDSINAKAG